MKNTDPDPTTSVTDLLALEAKVAELQDSFLRARADLENYRRRTERERDETATYAGSAVLAAMLPLLDDLDRAVAHLPAELQSNDWAKGVVQIRTNLEASFRRMGLERFGAPGERYDAELHEAVARGAGPADELTAILEYGYRYKDRVLRPAKVQVGGAEEPLAPSSQLSDDLPAA